MPSVLLSGHVPRKRIDLGKIPGGKVVVELTGPTTISSMGHRPPVGQQLCLRIPADVNGDRCVSVDYAIIDDDGKVFFPHLSGYPKRLTDFPRVVRLGAKLDSLSLESGSGGKNSHHSFQGPFQIIDLALVTATEVVIPEALQHVDDEDEPED